MRQEFEKCRLFRKISRIFDEFILPAGVASAAQVRRDFGMRSHAVVQAHHSGVVAEHGLVLHIHILHATIEHHVGPGHLKNSKKYLKFQHK